MKIGMKKTAAILVGVLTVTALAGCGQKKSEKAADLNFGDTYPGGAAKAIEDGVIIETTDYLDKYAPNLKSYLENHPNIDKMVKTDAGQYYSFPAIQGDDFLLTYILGCFRIFFADIFLFKLVLNENMPECNTSIVNLHVFIVHFLFFH